MKLLSTISALGLIILVGASVSFSSCTKSNAASVTTPKTDTVPDPVTLLTSATWKIQELRWFQVNTSGGGIEYYYMRDITSDIGQASTIRMKFNRDGTGSYALGSSLTGSVTWQFTNTEKSKLTWTIAYNIGGTQTINWENIDLTETRLRYAEYFVTNTGISSLASGTCIH